MRLSSDVLRLHFFYWSDCTVIVVNRRLYRDLHPEDTTTEADDLTLVTIQNLFIKGRYNDLGFLVGNRLLILVEAQTTWSYNILADYMAD